MTKPLPHLAAAAIFLLQLPTALGHSAPSAGSGMPAVGDANGDSKRRLSYDPATGRDLRNFPPHRSVDILHQRIELEAADMNTPRLVGSTTIRFSPIGGEAGAVRLHAAEIFVRQVSCEGRTATFSASPGSDDLDITLTPAVPFGQTADLRIDFEVNDPAEGIIWTPETPAWPQRPASFHSQGQPESNRFWFPTFDFPNERFTSEVIVTLPSGFQAVSNGRLSRRESAAFASGNAPAVRYHFMQDKEHAPYLISLAVGKWDVVDVSTDAAKLPMPVYVPIGQGPRVKRVFGRTPKMISLFERLFDEPYPWDQYAQVAVTNFAWGGMENTSATTLYDNIARDEIALADRDEDELISHELAHQWFGDLLTCRSWEHIWLNEGWATFSEALWEQYKDASLRTRSGACPTDGLRADADAYQYAIWKQFRSVIDEDHADAPFQPGMVSKEYGDPDDVFNRAANPYPKGAAVLHMLRQKLTEPVFWRGVALYVDRHRNQPVETFQFRMCLEEVSGLSLQRFFDQWCCRPGVPRLKVTPSWDSERRTLSVTVDQLQSIDGPNPAFAFDLPIWLTDGTSSPRTLTISVDARSTTASFLLDREPRRLVVDPDLTVLAEIELVQPVAAFAETLRAGPTAAARLMAARQLGGAEGGKGGPDALSAAARDNRAPLGVRLEALASLGRIANPGGNNDTQDEHASATDRSTPAASTDPEARTAAVHQLVVLGRAEPSDPRVRNELIKQLGIAGKSGALSRDDQKTITSLLLDRWNKDRSYSVRAESLRSLGRMKAIDAMAALAAGLKTDSHDDAIREGAIDGLAAAAFPDALDQILPMTVPAREQGVRQAAIKAAAKLEKLDPERVFNVLSALINDPALRTRRAAVEALLSLKDPRARPTVDQWVSGARGNSDKLWGKALLEKQ